MYIVEASNGMLIAEKRCRTEAKAVKIASEAANAGRILIINPELSKAENWFKIKSVRIYDTKNPDVDIDF